MSNSLLRVRRAVPLYFRFCISQKSSLKFIRNYEKLSVAAFNKVKASGYHSSSIANFRAGIKLNETIPEAQVVEEIKKNDSASKEKIIKGNAENLQFQAETQQLLHIVATSLYSDREVFIRELISNASDALEKLRFYKLTDEAAKDCSDSLSISIRVEPEKKIFEIQDNGVGMTREELIQNLGTIAHSGSKAFLNKLKESGKSSEGIIGQFGVGFYSTFMVGNSVTVYTKSSLPNSTGYCWKSDGTGTYSISEAENVDEGTTIIIHLRDDCLDFAKESKIIDLVKNMSNFVGFPVTVNGAKVNTVEPLWTLDPKKVTTEQHNEFYRFISAMWDTPTYHVLFRTDAPIDINALLYFPSSNTERFGMGQMDFGVSLYSKKVLIQKKPEKLLPTWLRFVKGIVDSADLPLNLSRELLQDSRLIGRIKSVLSNKIIRFLEERLKSDPKMYDTWFAEFGNFIREGVCTDSENSANIAKLLRFESSTRQEGELMSLQEYVNAMPDSQKEIYYISASDRKTAESSPYLEAFKDHTVLFSYEPLDEIVMTNLQKFAGKPLKSVESSDGLSSEQLPEKQDHVDEACRWFQDALGPQVTSVKPSRRLSSSPALVVDHESPAMRRILRQIDSKRTRAIKVNFEINLNHDLIKNILELRNKDEALARHLALQVFNNALISAGLVDDPRSLLPSINSLLEAITKLTEVKKN